MVFRAAPQLAGSRQCIRAGLTIDLDLDLDSAFVVTEKSGGVHVEIAGLVGALDSSRAVSAVLSPLQHRNRRRRSRPPSRRPPRVRRGSSTRRRGAWVGGALRARAARPRRVASRPARRCLKAPTRPAMLAGHGRRLPLFSVPRRSAVEVEIEVDGRRARRRRVVVGRMLPRRHAAARLPEHHATARRLPPGAESSLRAGRGIIARLRLIAAASTGASKSKAEADGWRRRRWRLRLLDANDAAPTSLRPSRLLRSPVGGSFSISRTSFSHAGRSCGEMTGSASWLSPEFLAVSLGGWRLPRRQSAWADGELKRQRRGRHVL